MRKLSESQIYWLRERAGLLTEEIDWDKNYRDYLEKRKKDYDYDSVTEEQFKIIYNELNPYVGKTLETEDSDSGVYVKCLYKYKDLSFASINGRKGLKLTGEVDVDASISGSEQIYAGYQGYSDRPSGPEYEDWEKNVEERIDFSITFVPFRDRKYDSLAVNWKYSDDLGGTNEDVSFVSEDEGDVGFDPSELENDILAPSVVMLDTFKNYDYEDL